jgi:hypothetical protein
MSTKESLSNFSKTKPPATGAMDTASVLPQRSGRMNFMMHLCMKKRIQKSAIIAFALLQNMHTNSVQSFTIYEPLKYRNVPTPYHVV